MHLVEHGHLSDLMRELGAQISWQRFVHYLCPFLSITLDQVSVLACPQRQPHLLDLLNIL